MQHAIDAQAQLVLQFWFPAGALTPRPAWFRKEPAFDQLITAEFGPLVQRAIGGGMRQWDAGGPRAVLARILLLDQFPRSIYRGTAQVFAGDALALEAARALVDADADLTLAPFERAFAYLPLVHAEDAALQREAVALFDRLRQAFPLTADMADFARRHQAVIARYGRFPHRNAVLGRTSTAEELAYLQQPGSGF